MKSLSVLALVIFVSLLLAQSPEVMLQKAIYQEEVLGDLEQAMATYRKISQMKSDKEDTIAQAATRLALCHEKLGNWKEVEVAYNKIIEKYSHLPSIMNHATLKLQEVIRRRQEKEIRELHEKIHSLASKKETPSENKTATPEKQPETSPEASPENSETSPQEATEAAPEVIAADLKKENDKEETVPEEKESEEKANARVNDILSDHLHRVASSLYQRGFFAGAKENLKKAISFNQENEKAKELLLKIDEILSHQETPRLMDHLAGASFYEVDENGEKKESAETILSEVSHFMEQKYDLKEIMSPESLVKLQEKSFRENLQQIIRFQHPEVEWRRPAFMEIKGDHLFISQTTIGHEKIQDFWEVAKENLAIIHPHIQILEIPQVHSYQQWRRLNPVFLPIHNGVSYTILNQKQREVFADILSQYPEYKNHQDIHKFISKGRVFQEKQDYRIPILRGYQDKSLYFDLYTTGLTFLFQKNDNDELKLQISSRKIQQPIDKIETSEGIIEVPASYDQTAVINLQTQQEEKHIILRGVQNPYSHKKLWIYLRLSKKNIRNILEEFTVPTKLSQEKTLLLRNYDISWNLPSHTKVDRQKKNSLISLFEESAFFSRAEHTIKVIGPNLVVYGPATLHKKVAETLQKIRENSNKACYLSTYLVSLNKTTLEKLFQKWQLTSQTHNSFQIYEISSEQDQVIQDLQQMEDISFHSTLGPVFIGNTQSIALKDYKLQSFLESLRKQETFLRSNIIDIRRGVSLEITPFIFSQEQSFLDFTSHIYQTPNEREILSGSTVNDSPSLRVPEVYIQKGYLRFSFQEKKIYLLDGFNCEDGEDQRFIFIILPKIVDNPMEKENYEPTTEK